MDYLFVGKRLMAFTIIFWGGGNLMLSIEQSRVTLGKKLLFFCCRCVSVFPLCKSKFCLCYVYHKGKYCNARGRLSFNWSFKCILKFLCCLSIRFMCLGTKNKLVKLRMKGEKVKNYMWKDSCNKILP